MTENGETRRTRRLERARAFLAAGRAQIDPAPPASPSEPSSGVPSRDGAAPARPDPTRFGDWEKNGRCIDF